MRIGRYQISNVSKDYIREEEDSFNIEVTHKYWYLWNIWIDLKWWHLYIEICRTDWNKCYKEKCKNYTPRCKHNMECNQCMECYKE